MNSRTLGAFLTVVISLIISPYLTAFDGFKMGDRCFLIDQKTAILFSKGNSEVLCLTWEKEFSSIALYKYDLAFPLYIRDFRIVRLPDGGIFLAWVEEFDFRKETTRISSISWDRAHKPKYTVIKKDENIACSSPLRVLYLGEGKYRFFCGDSSEMHIIQLMHLENFDKIKTFLYKEGKIFDERVLNKKGRFSIENYDVRRTGDNAFQVVWSQEYWSNRKHDIYLTSYALDCSTIGRPKKLYSFDDVDEISKGENPPSISSFMALEFIKDGIFIGRDIWHIPDPSGGDKDKAINFIYEVNLFGLEGTRKLNYRIDHASRGMASFYGYNEKEGMAYFVGEPTTPNKEPYCLTFNAISDIKYISKKVSASNSKGKTRNILLVHSEPDGFFYWLEVDESGNIQLRSQPVQEK
ncbi:MAG TPA: hypothetical protein PKJ37_01930 [Acidobacteriota bacterium]|nr:hypothetical protein [Acidobacteriota bacterium]HNT16641.1 hypothetical protein [Acidobacteriota bacterium]